MERDPATYCMDAEGNTLGRCGWCGSWERLWKMREIKVGRFIPVAVLNEDGDEELRWIPQIRRVEGCVSCQDLYWWETLQCNTREKREGVTLTPFITATSAQARLDQVELRLRDAQIAAIEAKLKLLGGA